MVGWWFSVIFFKRTSLPTNKYPLIFPNSFFLTMLKSTATLFNLHIFNLPKYKAQTTKLIKVQNLLSPIRKKKEEISSLRFHPPKSTLSLACAFGTLSSLSLRSKISILKLFLRFAALRSTFIFNLNFIWFFFIVWTIDLCSSGAFSSQPAGSFDPFLTNE